MFKLLIQTVKYSSWVLARLRRGFQVVNNDKQKSEDGSYSSHGLGRSGRNGLFSNNKKFDRASKNTYPGGERQGRKKFKKVRKENLFSFLHPGLDPGTSIFKRKWIPAFAGMTKHAVAAFTLISFLSQQCAFAQAVPVAQ